MAEESQNLMGPRDDVVARDPGAGRPPSPGLRSRPALRSAGVPVDRVVIIYNPQSRGPAQERAETLYRDLGEKAPHLTLTLRLTERAGHARELARDVAEQGGAPLVVSVSGDGGYHEVVNGVMAAANEHAAAAVEAAGHANDHRRATARQPLADAIGGGALRRIDLLRLRIGSGSRERVVYAHSYIGLGLSADVVVNLERPKGTLADVVTGFRTLAELKAVPIRDEQGARRELDSLLLANINRIGNFATLSDSRDPDDGRFDIITFPHASKWVTLALTLRAATFGLGAQPSATEMEFTPLQRVALQVDGEVVELDAEVPVRVEIARGALRTFC